MLWSDCKEIARYLLKEHPDADKLAISHDDLKAMIFEIPEFDKNQETPKKLENHLNSILWTWMRLGSDEF